MSSPFDVFRKNQRAMFAILGVVCMFTFVLAPSLMYLPDVFSSGTGGMTGPNPVAVSWTGGDIREHELVQMQVAHRIAVRFLQGILSKAVEKKASPKVFNLSMQNPGIPGDGGEEVVVDTLIWAEKAKRMGIVVNDEAVLDFIREVSAFALRPDEIKDLTNEATRRQMSEGELFEQLRLELMAQKARLAEDYSQRMSRAISLPEAWDYHNRLYRRVSIEAYPLEVSKFESQVTDKPTEKEKQELFEKYKHRDPNPNSPTPGFHRPPKLAFAYFKINFTPFLEAAKKEISEEKLKAEYDARVAKGDFKVSALPEEPKKEEPKEGDKPADDKKPTEEKKEEKKDDKEPAKPAEGEPKKDGCAEEPAEKPAADKAEAKAGEKTAENTEDPAKTPAEKKEEPPKRTQTFEEVKEKLHEQMASPFANDAMKKASQEATRAVNDYSRKYIAFQTSIKHKPGNRTVEEPGSFELERLGAQFGFETGSTPLINQFEAKEYEIGKRGVYYRFSEIRFIRNPADLVVPFPNFAFGQRLNEYNPHEIDSDDSNLKYIFWVTETKEPESPKITDKDVQDAILAAWTKDKAFELAKKEAAALAEKAKDKELKEVVADPAKILAPAPFSWMTVGAVAMGAGEPRLSTIEEIPLAGPDFMEAVCGLPVGAAAAAANFNHTLVYVTKVTGQAPTDEVLRERFLESGINSQIQQIATVETYMRNQRHSQEIAKEFAVVWHRPVGNQGQADE